MPPWWRKYHWPRFADAFHEANIGSSEMWFFGALKKLDVKIIGSNKNWSNKSVLVLKKKLTESAV